MKRIFPLVLLLIVVKGYAQDIHFTQYANSPITLNPANTGLINTDWRAAANYRNQWRAISGAPFITTTFSYDMALLKNKLNGSSLGVGILGLYDQAGSAKLTNKTVGISIAYHQKLNKSAERPSVLSFGVQGYFVQRAITQTIFGTPPTEFINVMDPYPDFNAGMLYTGSINKNTKVYAGASYYHITRPIESFLGSNYRLHTRLATHLGVSHDLNTLLNIYGSALYQRQGLAYEIMLGGAIGFNLNSTKIEKAKRKEVMLGTWYRYGDAFAPYLALAMKNAQLGFSYDVNTSSLAAATRGRGALEVSLIYNGAFGKNSSIASQYAVPRF